MAIARIEENPFVGVGLDLNSVTRPFGVEAFEYDVHNLVIGLWYKTGLLGLAGILLALLAIFRSGWAAILGSRSAGESRVAIALGCSLVAFVVFSMTAPILFTRFGWIAAALVLALRGVQQGGKPRRRPSSARGATGRRRRLPAVVRPRPTARPSSTESAARPSAERRAHTPAPLDRPAPRSQRVPTSASYIQAYVFASPSSSVISGSQPRRSLMRVLSLFRPLTP